MTLGLILSAGLYYGPDLWFPQANFLAGQCLSHDHWGVQPKLVVGTKKKNNKLYYLLQDEDKYEHLQYISREVVEHQASRVPCSKY